MATKSTRSAGSQFTARGVTQGNTLVGPQSGLPIDEVVDLAGTRRLAVDANISAQSIQVSVDLDPSEDGVFIGDPNTGNVLEIESDGSLNANVEIDAADGDNIAISDGTNTLLINPDGSINVNTNTDSATTFTIKNMVATLANTEYSYAFPASTKKFKIKARGSAKLQIAFTSGNTATEYITIFPGVLHEEVGLNLVSSTIYFRSTKPNETIEISSWA